MSIIKSTRVTRRQSLKQTEITSDTNKMKNDIASTVESDVEDDEWKRMNLASLQQTDPYIEEIKTYSPHVSIYNYDGKAWENTETSGPLFVYRRQCQPFDGFMILNRMSRDNVVQPINEKLSFDLNKHFLMYRTGDGSIHGIWFHDADESLRIYKQLKVMIDRAKSKSHGKSLRIPSPAMLPIIKTERQPDPSEKVRSPVINGIKESHSNSLVDLLAKAKIEEASRLTPRPASVQDTKPMISLEDIERSVLSSTTEEESDGILGSVGSRQDSIKPKSEPVSDVSSCYPRVNADNGDDEGRMKGLSILSSLMGHNRQSGSTTPKTAYNPFSSMTVEADLSESRFESTKLEDLNLSRTSTTLNGKNTTWNSILSEVDDFEQSQSSVVIKNEVLAMMDSNLQMPPIKAEVEHVRISKTSPCRPPDALLNVVNEQVAAAVTNLWSAFTREMDSNIRNRTTSVASSPTWSRTKIEDGANCSHKDDMIEALIRVLRTDPDVSRRVHLTYLEIQAARTKK